MRVTVGTAPDSWGVWFAQNPRQPPWQAFLDEVVEAGYSTIELGPYGYLPTDPRILKSNLDARGLRVSAGFMMPDLHRANSWQEISAEVDRVAQLLAEIHAPYLVLIPNVYSDLFTGERTGEATLSQDDWSRLIATAHAVADRARTTWGLTTVFHPHAETPVEYEHQISRFIDDTDADVISICLDIGHHAYRGGDVERFIERHHARIGYLHLKSVDSDIRDRVLREAIPFAEAVAMSVFVEPSAGVVDYVGVVGVLEAVGYQGYGIVEQDMYPVEFDKPLPIAKRTREYFASIGLV